MMVYRKSELTDPDYWRKKYETEKKTLSGILTISVGAALTVLGMYAGNCHADWTARELGQEDAVRYISQNIDDDVSRCVRSRMNRENNEEDESVQEYNRTRCNIIEDELDTLRHILIFHNNYWKRDGGLGPRKSR